MEKIVKSGDRCTTVTLDGTECAVKFSHEYNYFFVRSRGSDLAVSLESGRGFGDDGVMLCVSGGELSYPHMRGLDTVYLTGTGEADVYAANEGVNPFAKGIAPAEVSGEGDPVVVDGLTGGVPFNEVVVKGEDIVGREMKLNVSGKNLLPSEGSSAEKNGLTFTVGTDGSVTVNGTATTSTIFTLTNGVYLPKGTYTLSGCTGGSETTYRLQVFNGGSLIGLINADGSCTKTFTDDVYCDVVRIALDTGTVCDNVVFKPQLEMSSTATAYEPYRGVGYVITPDTSPYVVPTDIYQLEGRNVLFIEDDSRATVSVNGSRKSRQLAKIYAEIEELKTAMITMGGM